MGTVNQKIRFTKNAVDDIELALNEKGVTTTGVPLSIYGNLIRTLGNGGSTTVVEYETLTPCVKIGYKKMFTEYYVPRPLDYQGMNIQYIEDSEYDCECGYEPIPTPVKIDFVMN